MANAYFAADWANTPPQMQQFTPVRRPFNFQVNSTAGASYGTAGQPVVSTLGVGDTISLCPLPGQGSGIIITDYFIDFAKNDTNAAPTLVFSLGLLLDSLDPTMTSAAAAGFFATLITPNTATDTRLNPLAYLSNAATPVLLPVTYPVGVLPYSVSDFLPNLNGGQYEFALTVTAAAATVSAVAANNSGWIEYIQISQPWAK